jgi:predicted SAM-dependent methyltransferase
MDKIKLHLGCGKKYLPGYIHVDLDNGSHIDYPNTDMSKLSMFKDNEVDLIYNCGTFEYFDLQDAPKVLQEWYRVLKPGGVLQISVPDFESVVKVYLSNGKDILGEGILGLIYGRWPIKDINNDDQILYHKMIYDFKSLSNILSKAGFKNIKPYNWEDTLPSDYDDYSKAYVPYKDKNGIQMMLNLECIK